MCIPLCTKKINDMLEILSDSLLLDSEIFCYSAMLLQNEEDTDSNPFWQTFLGITLE